MCKLLYDTSPEPLGLSVGAWSMSAQSSRCSAGIHLLHTAGFVPRLNGLSVTLLLSCSDATTRPQDNGYFGRKRKMGSVFSPLASGFKKTLGPSWCTVAHSGCSMPWNPPVYVLNCASWAAVITSCLTCVWTRLVEFECQLAWSFSIFSSGHVFGSSSWGRRALEGQKDAVGQIMTLKEAKLLSLWSASNTVI